MRTLNNRNRLGLAAGAALLLGVAANSYGDYATTILGDSPAAYWRFNELNVATAPDYATNAGTFGFPGYGSYTGGAIHPVPGALASETTTGARFLGDNGRVAVPFNAAVMGTTSFTVEAWVKPAVAPPPSGQSSLAAVLSCGKISDPRSGWLIYQSATGWNLRAYTGVGTGTSINITGGPAPVANTWYHIAATFDGSTARVFVNGVEAATASNVSTFAANIEGAFSVGSRSDVAFPYNGDVDEVAYYTTALNAAAIASHYSAGTNTAPATSYAALIGASSPAIYLRLNEPGFTPPVAANSGSLGAAGNGVYNYWSATTPDLNTTPYPGFASTNTVLQTSGTNGFVSASGLNLNTSTVTFECWLKRNGSQSDYAGVLFHRGGGGTATGLDFRGTSDNLGYHWNDQADTYGWSSGLIPPDGVWTYVALAVSPEQAVLYMYDGTTWSSAVNAVAHPVQAFADTFRIGTDSGTSRFFTGLIDEAALYGKTLTEGQLRTHALAGFGDPTHSMPVFVADPPSVTPLGTIYTTTPFTLTADVYGEPPLTFQWKKDGVNINGATSASYTKIAAIGDAGAYTVQVTNPNGSATSQPVTIAVDPAVPPAITSQPLSRQVYPDATAAFTAIVEGTQPFTYQWKHAGTNLPGATQARLLVPNCTAAETGTYSVGITNVAGGVLSSTATLTLRVPTPGTFEEKVATNGPVAYWRLGESSGSVAFDYAGGNDATYNNVMQNQPGFVQGDANGCAGFDGGSSYVSAGRPLLNNRSQFTVMGWIKRSATHSTRGGYFGQNNLLEFGDAGGGTQIEAWIDATAGNIITSWPWADDQWGYIVLTGDGSANTLYIDGRPVATRASTVTSYGTNGFSFNIGGGGIFNDTGDYFNGYIDEVALYNKALSAETIATLYSAGLYGNTTAPFITVQPSSQNAVAGAPTALTVEARGSIPLGYQWKKAGVAIAGATASRLAFASVAYGDAGTYSVTISNAVNSVTSSDATLTVLPPPTFANVTNGLVLHMRFDGNLSDTSGRGNDGFAASTPPTYVAGKLGQAAHIASTLGDGFVYVIDQSQELSFDDVTSFTVAFWLKYTTRFNDVPIIGNAINSTYQLGWVFTDQGGMIEYSLVSTANSGTYVADPVAGSPLIDNGAWHHIVGIVDRSQQVASVYVDGSLAGTWSIVGLGTLATGNAITIGSDPTGNYGSATFDLDDLGIWRRALSGYEALSIYNAAQGASQSFDVYGPVKVNIATTGTGAVVAWQAGTLESNDDITNPNGWAPVPNATAPAFNIVPGTGKKYYRVRL